MGREGRQSQTNAEWGEVLCRANKEKREEEQEFGDGERENTGKRVTGLKEQGWAKGALVESHYTGKNTEKSETGGALHDEGLNKLSGKGELKRRAMNEEFYNRRLQNLTIRGLS